MGGFFGIARMADAPVDLVHLARYTGGDRTLNVEILRLFNGQLGDMVGQLLTVLQQRDAREMRAGGEAGGHEHYRRLKAAWPHA